MSDALLDAILALDLQLLRAHTEAAGDRLDPAAHRESLRASLAQGEAVTVWRETGLAAYCLLRPLPQAGDWFVGGLGLHPAQRAGAGVLRGLLRELRSRCAQLGVQRLHSHVYRTNAASLRFHRRLGFAVVRENDKALAFSAALAELRLPREL